MIRTLLHRLRHRIAAPIVGPVQAERDALQARLDAQVPADPNSAIRAFAEAINVDIVTRRYAGQDNRHIARFDDCYVKEGGLIGGIYGSGTTAEDALADYGKRIAGAQLVFHPDDDRRRVVVAPASFEVTS